MIVDLSPSVLPNARRRRSREMTTETDINGDSAEESPQNFALLIQQEGKTN